MAVFRLAEAQRFPMHGSVFDSVVRTERGSRQLCAWRLTVPAGSIGMPHHPNREEVLLVLAGQLVVAIDGHTDRVGPDDVVLVPAGAEFRVDGGAQDATVWVTTTAGLTATTADGQQLSPPWAQ